MKRIAIWINVSDILNVFISLGYFYNFCLYFHRFFFLENSQQKLEIQMEFNAVKYWREKWSCSILDATNLAIYSKIRSVHCINTLIVYKMEIANELNRV